MNNTVTKPFKFRPGDLVQVAKDLGLSMSHFTADCRAIVVERDGTELGLYIEGEGESYWYESNQVTLIERNQGDLLEQWQDDAEVLRKQQGDIEWIFANWNKMNGAIPSATIETLASYCGSGDMWGSRGEGMDYYFNAMQVLGHCRPYLDANNLVGFIASHPKKEFQP